MGYEMFKNFMGATRIPGHKRKTSDSGAWHAAAVVFAFFLFSGVTDADGSGSRRSLIVVLHTSPAPT